jgi:PAS domain S-box-containing protein
VEPVAPVLIAADLSADLVEHVPIGVVAVDHVGRVLVWNAAAQRLTGWPAGDVLGRRLQDMPMDAGGSTRIADELRAGRPFAGRFPALGTGGPTLYFRAVPDPLPGVAALAVLQDVVDTRAGDEAFALLDALWESAPVGLAYFDTGLRYRRVNGAVLDLDGGTADDRIGRTLESVHGATGAEFARHLRRALDERRARTDIPVRGRLWHGAGPVQEWRANVYPVHGPAGQLLGAGIVLLDVTAAERTRRELERVAAQRELALDRYQSLVEASSAAVWVREADGTALRDAPGLRAITGQSPEQMRGLGFLDAVHPAHRDAWRAGWERAVAAEPVGPFTVDYRLRTAAGGYRWFRSRAVPVRTGGRVAQWVGTETDIDDTVRAGVRLDLLARATHAMTAADRDGDAGGPAALAALTAATVPAFADLCRVYRVDPDRGTGAVTGSRGATATAPGLEPPPATDLRFVFGAEHPVARAVRTRAPLLATAPDAEPGWQPAPVVRRWSTAVGAHSTLVVPVQADGIVVAVLLFLACADRPAYTADDLGVAGELGVRASAAVERATAFHHHRQVAVALQGAMLTEPPAVPGLEIAARYLPAAADLAVGGDWFDAHVLPGGDVAVGVGDVAGHDLPAAVEMGQLRNMLRALADPVAPPSAAVSRLDEVATRLDVTRFTTLVHGRIRTRPGGGAEFAWCNAGHPPPVLVTADGVAAFLDGPVDVVLGVAPGTVRRDGAALLPPGSTLLLYTDGLVERRRDLDERAAADLLDLVRAHADRPLGEFCEHLVRTTPADTDDDTVVLAVRVAP